MSTLSQFAIHNTSSLVSLPHITLLALNMRFSRQERDDIRAAQISDPDVSDIMYLMQQSSYIDLEHPVTLAAISMFETKGLILPGRSSQILSTIVHPSEMPG